MKKDPPGAPKGARQNDPARKEPPGTPPQKNDAAGVDHRAAQRHHRQSEAAELSAANVEESPHMDRGDSALGAGESLSHGRETPSEAEQAAESLRNGALDTQYGTKSSMKTGQPAESATAESAKGGDRAPAAPNPGTSEASSGAERDTMTGPRPGRGG